MWKIERGPKILYWQLPYKPCREQETRRTFDFINKNLEDTKIQIAFNTKKTRSFFPNKDPVEKSLQSNVVYKYNCGSCEKLYIGETVRHLSTRIAEHHKGQPTATEVTKHEHEFKEENFTVLLRTKHTKIAEAIILKQEAVNKILNENSRQTPIYLF